MTRIDAIRLITEMPESKRERFVRLATKRVNRAINELRLVGNLANRSHYEFSEEDIRRISRVLEDELRAMKSRFESRTPSRDVDFTL